MKGVLLRSRDGRRFLVAQLMDSMAGGLSLVVLPWIVLDAGGSRSLAGAAFLIATIPYLALGLHAGELGDRRRRQPIMVWSAAIQAAAAAVLPAIVALGPAARDLPVALIFAAGMGVTAGRVFVDAAAFGATARLVGDSHFVEGQANLSLVWSLGFLIGPALGGGLIGLVGAVEALWVEAAGFAVAAALLASIRSDLGPEHDSGPSAGVLSGLGVVARDRSLRRLTSISMAWNLTVNVFYALMVVFLRTELHASGPDAGRMLAIGGAAGLAGGALAPLARHRLGATAALRLGLVGSATATVALALAPGLGAATVGVRRPRDHGPLLHHARDRRAPDPRRPGPAGPGRASPGGWRRCWRPRSAPWRRAPSSRCCRRATCSRSRRRPRWASRPSRCRSSGSRADSRLRPAAARPAGPTCVALSARPK